MLIAVLVSGAVGGFLATELAVLLCRALVQPVERLSVAMRAVRAGDYSARVPVMSSDEIGELSHDFTCNGMDLHAFSLRVGAMEVTEFFTGTGRAHDAQVAGTAN